MKVGYHGLGAVRHTSIIVALLVCTATFVWTWKRGLILGHQVRFELTQDGVPVATVKSGGELVKSGGELLAVGELSNEFRNKETNDNREISTRIDERESDEETGKEEMNIEEGRVSEEEDRRDRSENIEGSEERYLNRSEVKVCNYANGKWVVDHTHTLYSGFSCKQWLRPSWSCRLSRRPNFAYENLRWQPKDCPLERFEGSKFLKRLQNKTLAFVGDSLGKQQFLSLICMITGGKQRSDIVDIRKGYGMSQALRFPSTNTTILYYCSTTLCDIKPMNKTNPDTNYAMHLDRPASFLIKYVHKIDVLVLNTMHHWSQGKFKANGWVTHVGGMPNTNKNLEQIWQARNLTIHNVVDWGNKQLAKYPNLKVFYRTMSPRHFSGGDWNSGGSCDNSILMSVGKEIVQDSSSDSVAVSAVKGTGVRLLDITALTGVRDEAHISRYHGKHISTSSDCSHWCLPGVPDTWNEILFAQL